MPLLYEIIHRPDDAGSFVPFAEVARFFNYDNIVLGPRVIVDRKKMNTRKLTDLDKMRISRRADEISRSV